MCFLVFCHTNCVNYNEFQYNCLLRLSTFSTNYCKGYSCLILKCVTRNVQEKRSPFIKMVILLIYKKADFQVWKFFNNQHVQQLVRMVSEVMMTVIDLPPAPPRWAIFPRRRRKQGGLAEPTLPFSPFAVRSTLPTASLTRLHPTHCYGVYRWPWLWGLVCLKEGYLLYHVSTETVTELLTVY